MKKCLALNNSGSRWRCKSHNEVRSERKARVAHSIESGLLVLVIVSRSMLFIYTHCRYLSVALRYHPLSPSKFVLIDDLRQTTRDSIFMNIYAFLPCNLFILPSTYEVGNRKAPCSRPICTSLLWHIIVLYTPIINRNWWVNCTSSSLVCTDVYLHKIYSRILESCGWYI